MQNSFRRSLSSFNIVLPVIYVGMNRIDGNSHHTPKIDSWAVQLMNSDLVLVICQAVFLLISFQAEHFTNIFKHIHQVVVRLSSFLTNTQVHKKSQRVDVSYLSSLHFVQAVYML